MLAFWYIFHKMLLVNIDYRSSSVSSFGVSDSSSGNCRTKSTTIRTSCCRRISKKFDSMETVEKKRPTISYNVQECIDIMKIKYTTNKRCFKLKRLFFAKQKHLKTSWNIQIEEKEEMSSQAALSAFFILQQWTKILL